MKRRIIYSLIFSVLLSTFVVGEVEAFNDDGVTKPTQETGLISNKHEKKSEVFKVSNSHISKTFSSITEAIEMINADMENDNYTIDILQPVVNIDSSIVIQSGKTITIKSNQSIIKQDTAQARHFIVYGVLILENTVLDGQQFGGGISVIDGELVIRNATIQNCYTLFNGGGILAENSKITMFDGLIYNNKTSKNGVSGGGISLTESSTFDMKKGVVSHNQSTWGGGVSVGKESQFIMSNGTISNNATYDEGQNSGGYGGGVHVYVRATFTMLGGAIEHNKSYTGAGVFVGQGTHVSGEPTDWCLFQMKGGHISYNVASLAGGGISQGYNGNVSIDKGDILNNSAKSAGGIFVNGMTMTNEANGISFIMKEGSILNNQATFGTGGGIYVTGDPIVNNRLNVVIGDKKIQDAVLIEGNTSSSYGGGVALFNAPAQMHNVKMIKNESESHGGAIVLMKNSDLEMAHVTIGSAQDNLINKAKGHGGAIATFDQKNTLTIKESTILGNVSQSSNKGGGGIYLGALDKANIIDTELVGNKSQEMHGGAIYLSKTAFLELNASSLESNIAAKEGGAIYTENYENYNSLEKEDYQNLKINKETFFDKNIANQGYLPPEIVYSYSNIEYATSSSLNAQGAFVHPINNLDINYVGNELLEKYYKITYHPNGGEGDIKSDIALKDSDYTILSHKNIEMDYKRENYEFIGWNTQSDGSGTSYDARELYKVIDNLNLFAQWKQIDDVEELEEPKHPDVIDEGKDIDDSKEVEKEEVLGVSKDVVETSDIYEGGKYIVFMIAMFLVLGYLIKKESID